MLSSFVAFFSREFSYEKLEENYEPQVSNFIYRDHLNKNPSAANKPKKGKEVSFASNVKPELLEAGHGEKGGKNNLEGIIRRRRSCHASSESKGVNNFRVKIKMTKEEADRFLSKCKNGGVIGFKDVETELMQIPMNRVDVICPSINGTGSVLKSIPEEF